MNNHNVLKCLFMLIIVEGVVGDYPCNVHESVNIQDGVHHPNGSLSHMGIVYHSHLNFVYDPEDGHQEKLSNSSDFNEKHRRGCICKLKSCYRKCCPQNQSLSLSKKCVDHEKIFYHNVVTKNLSWIPGDDPLESFGVVYDIPCEKYSVITTEPGSTYTLYEDGLVMVDGEEKMYKPHEYCIDDLLTDNGADKVILMKCDGNPGELTNATKRLMHIIGMVLSLPFLIATLIVYIILPELRTLHGKSLMCYVGSLMIAYITLITRNAVVFRNTPCVVIGYMTYYFFMLSFFWLNVISYDIWWTFSGFRGHRNRTKLTSEQKKFVYFWLYSFGCATTAVIILLSIEFNDSVNLQHKPAIGLDDKCWFQTSTEMPYFYGPLIALALVNIIFFSITAVKIYIISRSTEVLQREGSTRHCPAESDTQRFWLYIKLFLVMGMTWTIEIFNYWIEGPSWFWIFPDCINTLQGILIFVIFVWKPKIRKMLKKKLRGIRETPAKTSGTTGSSSGFSSMASVEQVKLNEVPNPDPV